MGECTPQAIKKITSKLFTLPVQAEVDKAGDTIAHPKGLLPSIDNIMNWDFHCSEICVILLVMVYTLISPLLLISCGFQNFIHICRIGAINAAASMEDC